MVTGLLLSIATSTFAAVYYVDAILGNDSWSGLLPAPSSLPATNGPWQSLRRVEGAVLNPGDEVRLRCGQTWRETLRIGQSGTAEQPIQVKGYPAPCAERPQIDGSITIPAYEWKQDYGSVYRAALPVNLVENGDLFRTVEKWSYWSALPGASIAFSTYCPANATGCLRLSTSSASRSYVISPNFALQGGAEYRLTYAYYAANGVPVTATVRRSGPESYVPLGGIDSSTGSGAWQTRSLLFTASNSDRKARVDFSVAAGAETVYLRNVRLSPVTGAPAMLFMDGRHLQVAHHPNFGFDGSSENAIYLKNDVDSNQVSTATGMGSTFLTVGADLQLPTGASIKPGMGVLLRSENWNVDERKVSSASSNRLYLDTPTRYPFRKNWGYVLTGADWMVDGADEWAFDASSNEITVWMPDGAEPGSRLSYAALETGVELNGRSHIQVDGIGVRGVETGVSATWGNHIELRNLRVEDVSGLGVNFARTNNSLVLDSRFVRTGLDAIGGCKESTVTCGTGNAAERNDIIDSGVQRVSGKTVSLPAPLYAAIEVGRDATVSGNRINGAGATGIFAFGAGNIHGNSITDVCLVVDDCGGIYGSRYASGSSITGNLIGNVIGNVAGTDIPTTRAVGIYLDEQATNMEVRGNFVYGADYGIQVHNAFDNVLQSNSLYGNRRAQLWFQEQTRATRIDGDIHSNRVLGNTFFPTSNAPAVVMKSYLGSTNDFATFDSNIYSVLMGPQVVSEDSPFRVENHTFPEWRTATWNDMPRNLDVGGSVIAMGTYTPFRPSGGNVIPNSDLASGDNGWRGWNELPPLQQLQLASGSIGRFLLFIAGGSKSVLSSPNFSVQGGQWYRVSFDAATGKAQQTITVLPRRGGGGTAGYEALAANKFTFAGTSTWTRYSFVFKASKTVTAGDPATGEFGARIDFTDVAAGDTVSVAHLEMVPLAPVDAILRTALLANPSTSVSASIECPDKGSRSDECHQYVDVSSGDSVVWPKSLAPLAAEIVYTRDESLFDADEDGIPDLVDQCPNTLAARAVNASGCALWQ